MGRYDDITDEQLRSEIARFARILQRMEAKDEILDRTADILNLLAELRRMVFAWEVKCTFSEEGEAETASREDVVSGSSRSRKRKPPKGESDGERIVREARELEERLRRDLEGEGRSGDDGGG